MLLHTTPPTSPISNMTVYRVDSVPTSFSIRFSGTADAALHGLVLCDPNANSQTTSRDSVEPPAMFTMCVSIYSIYIQYLYIQYVQTICTGQHFFLTNENSISLQERILCATHLYCMMPPPTSQLTVFPPLLWTGEVLALTSPT